MSQLPPWAREATEATFSERRHVMQPLSPPLVEAMSEASAPGPDEVGALVEALGRQPAQGPESPFTRAFSLDRAAAARRRVIGGAFGAGLALGAALLAGRVAAEQAGWTMPLPGSVLGSELVGDLVGALQEPDPAGPGVFEHPPEETATCDAEPLEAELLAGSPSPGGFADGAEPLALHLGARPAELGIGGSRKLEDLVRERAADGEGPGGAAGSTDRPRLPPHLIPLVGSSDRVPPEARASNPASPHGRPGSGPTGTATADVAGRPGGLPGGGMDSAAEATVGLPRGPISAGARHGIADRGYDLPEPDEDRFGTCPVPLRSPVERLAALTDRQPAEKAVGSSPSNGGDKAPGAGRPTRSKPRSSGKKPAPKPAVASAPAPSSSSDPASRAAGGSASPAGAPSAGSALDQVIFGPSIALPECDQPGE